MVFVIHWHESVMDLHVLPIPIPPPTSLSTWFLWVFPVHQARALVSCIQPGLVICFTLGNIPYMQNRKRDTDVQNRLLDSVGEGEGGMFREKSIKTCVFSYLFKAVSCFIGIWSLYVLCEFLLYNVRDQPYVSYMSSLLSLPLNPPFLPSRSSQSMSVFSVIYRASHYPFYTW